MRYLITGGYGFIGSALIRKLSSRSNEEILNIDKLTYAGNINNLPKKMKCKYLFEKSDIQNKNKINKIFHKFKPDIVLNFAAESHVDRSINNSPEFINTNILGTYNLLEASKELYFNLDAKKKKSFKFIQISTDEVYGDIPGKRSSTEKDRYNPNSPYAASKAAADQLVRAWGRTYSLPTITTHCCNNFGPYQFPEKLIPLIILNAIEHKPLPIYGNGKQVREWIFVDDNINAILKLIKKGNAGEHYNISSGSLICNIDLVKKICDKLDRIIPSDKVSNYSSLIVRVEDRPAHDKRYSINSNKIKKLCTWKIKNSFDEDLEKTILWYIENINWFYNIKGMRSIRNRKGLL